MKRNKLMRLASILLVMTLLSTCVIGGTFAKYITSDSAKDTARVAKFGVVASINGKLFGETYTKGDISTQSKITNYGEHTESVSVKATGTNVVAPGTKGDPLDFIVKGTPEVSTAVTFGDALTENGISEKAYSSDITLAAGTYAVMQQWPGTITNETVIGKYTLDAGVYTKVTTAPSTLPSVVYEAHDVAAVGAQYYPIDWIVTGGTTSPAEYTSIGAAKKAVSDIFSGKSFTPNSANDLSGSLTWRWDFEQANPLATDSIYYDNDKADTILGDMIQAAIESSDQVVVAVTTNSGSTYTTVKYVEVPVGAADSTTNAYVAYTGTAPTLAPTSGDSGTTLPENMWAVLTVNFQASLTVAQVD